MAKCAVILASHGFMAVEAVNSAGMILGDQPKNVDVVSVTPDKSYEECLDELHQKYEALDTTNGCLMFTDIYGGTPANIASYLSIEHPNDVVVFSGLNLPVLLEIFLDMNSDLKELEKKIETLIPTVCVNVSKKIKERMEEDADQMCSY
ncbi:PTS sugar transporter subunit IIA [uncultured Traorella sp.]|uniref:PTS sugar transporter subunit IIA n=1 Tax=uncultured Traorella sp. TaxID=1929048 RepID=UPI0025E09261|nr:PTS sugar transporter subunit IIA [uncultured Traorella sp.]